MKKNYLVMGSVAIIGLICALGGGALAGAGLFYYWSQAATETATTTEISSTAVDPSSLDDPVDAPQTNTKPNQSPINPTSISLSEPTETERLLAETEVPVRDLRALASRLKHGGRELPIVAHVEPPVYQIGDQDTFWVVDNTRQPPVQFQATATLQYITDHTHWWVEDGFIISQRDLAQSAEVFETQIYPTTRAFFGSEWSPGVDNDVHISIYLGRVPGVGGYYASSHEFSQAVDPRSNEREMFLINLEALKPGNTAFESVLAHEFQHMIHWYQDRNEETWVNEGFSELAVLLNGFAPDRSQDQYLQNPDLQLTTWAHGLSSTVPHYGSSYLFMAYFLDRFGEEMMKAVVAEDGNGVQGFNNVLQAHGYTETFDDVFADFVLANYLNDPDLADGRWGYRQVTIKPVQPEIRHQAFPIDREGTVHQYGVDYIELQHDGPLTIEFLGATVIPLIDNQAHSGQYQWYGNRGDDSNATLTRAVDLQTVESATLIYWAWYDIEEDWDYAYVEVSTDEGQSWTILQAPHSRTTNPTGNAYGPGYTATSNGWVEETIDLSAFTGQEILLRFEYVTDDATNGPGFALDDVTIPEIGFFDDMETPDAEWQAAGFIRIDNQMRQQYIVQIIDLIDHATVTKMVLDGTNGGQLTIGEADEETHAILVISAQAPVTTEIAGYQYKISPAE